MDMRASIDVRGLAVGVVLGALGCGPAEGEPVEFVRGIYRYEAELEMSCNPAERALVCEGGIELDEQGRLGLFYAFAFESPSEFWAIEQESEIPPLEDPLTFGYDGDEPACDGAETMHLELTAWIPETGTIEFTRERHMPHCDETPDCTLVSEGTYTLVEPCELPCKLTEVPANVSGDSQNCQLATCECP